MDRQRLSDKLDELSRYYDELLDDLPAKKMFIQDRVRRRGIEKTIELIAETIIDIGILLIAGLSLQKPNDLRSIMDVLQEAGIVSKPLAGKMKDFLSFRNLLVHRYGKIDMEKEFNHIKECHVDIEDFMTAIDRYLKGK